MLQAPADFRHLKGGIRFIANCTAPPALRIASGADFPGATGPAQRGVRDVHGVYSL